MSEDLKAPFPWFGGKRQVAPLVWARLGDVRNYVEPFAGSLAVLLGRPHWDQERSTWASDPFIRCETVNDLDGCCTNFWRAVKADPECVAEWASNPVHELDLHARHIWLNRRLADRDGIEPEILARCQKRGIAPFSGRLEQDPTWYCAQVAGWWAWGLSSWIGDNWASPQCWSLPHLGNAGRGVKRQLPHLGNAGVGVNRQLPHLGDAGQGVNRRQRDVGPVADGECARRLAVLCEWFGRLADRLRGVDVCCGDWERVCGPTPTLHRGGAPCGVFLDPPYSQDHGLETVYGAYHDRDVSARVLEWCIERGQNRDMRIALCGYDTEHAALHEQHGWQVAAWKARGGYGNQGQDSRGHQNAHRERVWFSPGCLTPEGGDTLFGGAP
jgi:site-specific DNA-adenine methylase